LAALNAKVEAANAALTQVQKATASEAMTKGLSELADNIKTTNAALADIQRTIAAGNVRDRLDTLEKNLKAIDASLAGLQKSQQAADISGKVAALQSDVKALGGKLADVPQATALKGVTDQLAAIKQAIPEQNLADQIGPLNDKIKSLNDTLADIQKSTSLDGVKTQLAALNSKLESANEAVGGGQEDTAALKTVIAELKDAAKPQPKESVVFYLHMPNEENLPAKVASVSPLDIQFEKIGSTDDSGQAALIIPKLKTLVAGRKDCTVSVAGYADTVGGDAVNLKISQQRAKNIAQKIKAAFEGSEVKVDEAAWGERRLKAWTPDGTANENNRRVDIAVNCKS
jgi:outer membrane protein OmpA-like peptidoglycan-associated protein